MTDKPVELSITVKVYGEVIEYRREIAMAELETGISQVVQEIGTKVLVAGLKGLDEELRKGVPAGWRNVGTEERSIMSSVGRIRYSRRIYKDEKGVRRKPVDEVLGVERYDRESQRVQQMGAYLACEGTYRRAASQMSWLMKTKVSHSTIQKMVWQVGNRIADGEEAERRRVFEGGEAIAKGKVKAEVLYGESDGVWLHLQREKRRSVEVRVATLYSGKKPLGKKRYRLADKCSIAALGLSGDAWQEHVLKTAHRYYDLEQTRLLITGGDGNQWVRHTFQRFELPQEFVLDRFHLSRAARRAIGDRVAAQEMVKKLRQKDFAAVCQELRQSIEQASGRRKEKLKQFYQYIYNQQDGLLDLSHRGYSSELGSLGAIEGNVDKLVIHRMKGRGCCWKLQGARAMLALCQHKEALKQLSYQYLPLEPPEQPNRRKRLALDRLDRSEYLDAHMPIFDGPDQDKPWVKELYRYVHWH
jgi:hypothetical protein